MSKLLSENVCYCYFFCPRVHISQFTIFHHLSCFIIFVTAFLECSFFWIFFFGFVTTAYAFQKWLQSFKTFHELSCILQLNPWRRAVLEKLIVVQLVKKIPRFLWNSKICYRVYKSQPESLILSLLNLVNILILLFIFISILPCHLCLGFPNGLFLQK
jgi:hypothetical protein